MQRKHIPYLQSKALSARHTPGMRILSPGQEVARIQKMWPHCIDTRLVTIVFLWGKRRTEVMEFHHSITDNPYLPGPELQTWPSLVGPVILANSHWARNQHQTGFFFPWEGDFFSGPQEHNLSNTAFASALSILSKSVQPSKPLNPLPARLYPPSSQIAPRSLLTNPVFHKATSLSWDKLNKTKEDACWWGRSFMASLALPLEVKLGHTHSLMFMVWLTGLNGTMGKNPLFNFVVSASEIIMLLFPCEQQQGRQYGLQTHTSLGRRCISWWPWPYFFWNSVHSRFPCM